MGEAGWCACRCHGVDVAQTGACCLFLLRGSRFVALASFLGVCTSRPASSPCALWCSPGGSACNPLLKLSSVAFNAMMSVCTMFARGVRRAVGVRASMDVGVRRRDFPSFLRFSFRRQRFAWRVTGFPRAFTRPSSKTAGSLVAGSAVCGLLFSAKREFPLRRFRGLP